MNAKALISKLAKRFPKRIGEKRDYLGIQINKLPKEVNKIMLCLDFDYETYQIMLKNKPDLILTHHPFIYGTFMRVKNSSIEKGRLIDLMLENKTPIYSMHTNFDAGKDGMNDALASRLNLKNIKPLDTLPMARGGELEKEMDIISLAKFAKEQFKVNNGWLINSGKKSIKKVAIVGGAGWYFYKNAKLEGYDIFISGDIPHHGRRDIIMENYNFLDLPHEIEKIFIPQMKKILLEIDPNLEIIEYDHEKEPILI